MRFITLALLFFQIVIQAQTNPTKKDSTIILEEVKLIAKTKHTIETEMKMAVSIDDFLASSASISFVKRGAYAWEPLLNNMSTERSVITIDGMHVFGACTDKMDPVTSYMESNMISSIDIKSGQEGGVHGATIAGSIDLKSKNTSFGLKKKWNGAYQTGFEFNNKQFFNLANLSYSSDRFVWDGTVSYREAANYKNGRDNEVEHSQYHKFNTSLGLAYKTSALSSLRIDAIFDQAKDVGFPALPMDLWLSRAIITSATYKQFFEKGLLRVWDTKIYFNAIEHYMDDTKRPENLVHMDMPGWSTTYGFLSKANLKKERFSSEIQLNAYTNLSIAEMRMYPQDRNNRTMFAYSWPSITTSFAGLSINNSLEFSKISQVNFGGSLAMNYNYSKYVEFNWIFHPGTPQEKTRIVPSLHTSYDLIINNFNFSVGTGYGQRAPSISEGYGYYIYNSFDRYDYIGNPDLKNETSYEGKASAGFKNQKASIQAQVNYFYIENYIIGRILSMGSPMNYQSIGVKGYMQLKYATVFNFSLNGAYFILPDLQCKAMLTYARAKDDTDKNVPFIRPISYQTSLHYKYKKLGIQAWVNGDLEQINYSPEYGEDRTPSYMILNLSTDYNFLVKDSKIVLQVGVENVLNEYYSTYADWGNIPRMGRNVFTSLKFNF